MAIYRRGDMPVLLRNNVIADNDADDYGSGLWGGISETRPVGVQLEHNTIADNNGGDAAVSLQRASSLQMNNNIVSGHNLGVLAIAGGAIAMDSTLWHENVSDTGGAGVIAHANDYTGDPGYADPPSWNYHIASDSEALDVAADIVGVPLDMDGQTRSNPDTSLPDLGADRYYCTAPTKITLTGPQTTSTGCPTPFTAEVEPSFTNLPLTYTWEATGQADVIRQGALSDTLSFIYAFEQTGRIGIGKKMDGTRGLYALRSVKQFGEVVFSEESNRLQCAGSPEDLAVSGSSAMSAASEESAGKTNPRKIRVVLNTPLRLKFQNRLKADLPFHVLARAMLRRVSSLFAVYGDAEPDLDYSGLVKRAESVATLESALSWCDWKRYSQRQDQQMFMGGMSDSVAYDGVADEYVPLLDICSKVHLGKQTAFGLGKISWEILE